MTRIAVVTGASRGIGKSICHELVRQDWTVVAVHRVHGTVGPADYAGDRLVPEQADVTDATQVAALADRVGKKFARVDLLVNVAGVMQPQGLVATTTPADWKVTLATNLDGPFLMAQAFHELLVSTSGSAVINVTGILGSFSAGMVGGGQPAYRVSKAGLNALSLTLAEELRDKGVSVVAFDPGWVRTDLGGPDAPRSVEEVAAEFVEMISKPLPTGVLLRNGEIGQW